MFNPPPDAGRLDHLLCLGCGRAKATRINHPLLGHHRVFCSDACAIGWAILKALTERLTATN
jgi:hypothetical protein